MTLQEVMMHLGYALAFSYTGFIFGIIAIFISVIGIIWMANIVKKMKRKKKRKDK